LTYASCAYVCPVNSYQRPNRTCYDTFNDCDCNSGYHKSTTGEKCVELVPLQAPVAVPVQAPVKAPASACSFVCPVNSYQRPNRTCYNTFNDCACNRGYSKSNTEEKCVVAIPVQAPAKAPASTCTFVCPANSYQRPNRTCYNTFNDCACNRGYYKSTTDEKCIQLTPVRAPVRAPVKAPASTCTFTIGQAFRDTFDIEVTISIAPLPGNRGITLNVTESDADSIGDLRGLFFNVSNTCSLGERSAINGSKVTEIQVMENGVISLGKGANMNGNGDKMYDVGVEIGSQSIGRDDVQSTVIDVAWSGLTLAHLCGQAFGVRLTSSGYNGGRRAYNAKMFGQSCACES
jgi:hypothetical protein